MTHTPLTSGKQLTSAVLYGAAVVALYSFLYLYEDELLDLAGHGRWYFVVPVAIAFLFSLAHGMFTARFWDLLGVRARR